MICDECRRNLLCSLCTRKVGEWLLTVTLPDDTMTHVCGECFARYERECSPWPPPYPTFHHWLDAQEKRPILEEGK